MTPTEITSHLQRANVLPLLEWAQDWLLSASYRDIQTLAGQIPARQREHFIALCRDLLSDFPEVMHGLPILLNFEDSECESLRLPLPDDHQAPPDPRVRKLGWLKLDTLRSNEAFGLASQNVFVPSGGIHCAVLLVQTAGPDAPELPDSWFGELFAEAVPDHARLQVSSRICLPWPDAVECGQRLLCAARAETYEGEGEPPRLFLRDSGWNWSVTAGIEWRRMLAAQKE